MRFLWNCKAWNCLYLRIYLYYYYQFVGIHIKKYRSESSDISKMLNKTSLVGIPWPQQWFLIYSWTKVLLWEFWDPGRLVNLSAAQVWEKLLWEARFATKQLPCLLWAQLSKQEQLPTLDNSASALSGFGLLPTPYTKDLAELCPPVLWVVAKVLAVDP